MEELESMMVSVVIPLHNKAPYLRECLESVLAQGHRDLEVLVVDDASTDAGPAIAATTGDPRVRLIRLERNMGPGLAAQWGMDEALGAYIARMDADDVMHPGRIALQAAFLDRHPEVDICGTAMDLVGRTEVIRRSPASHEDIAAQLLFGVGLFQPTMMVRRTALDRSGLRYRPDWPWYGEDRLLQLEAMQRGLRLASLPQVLLHYREGPQNTVHRVDRYSAIAALDTAVLSAWGHPSPTADQLVLHAFASKRFAAPPTAAQVTAFRAWLDHLVAWSASVPLLDAKAVERRCVKAWEELFHFLPFHGRATVKAYLAAGGRLSLARIYYALRSWFTGPGKVAS
jgi:GT2 family glycosyltransferase